MSYLKQLVITYSFVFLQTAPPCIHFTTFVTIISFRPVFSPFCDMSAYTYEGRMLHINRT